MTVSALSLSHSGTGQNVDALQYYQQAFPSLQISLRNNDDLVSDGLFLTHFLLLIYEVSLSRMSHIVCASLILILSAFLSGRSRRAPRLQPLVSPHLSSPPHRPPPPIQTRPRTTPLHSLVDLSHRPICPAQRCRNRRVRTNHHGQPDAPGIR